MVASSSEIGLGDLTRCVDDGRRDWVERLRAYVSIPSVFALPEPIAERTRICLEGGLRRELIPHHEAMAGRLAADLAGLGLGVSVGRGTLPGDEAGIPYVRARAGGGEAVALLFSSHYDVVGAGAGWETDPFAAVEREGWIYGRGCSDAKGPVAAMVSACEVLSRLGWQPRRGLELVFTGDEEVGGRRGIRSASLAGELAAEACVVGEPSALDGRIVAAVMTRGRVEVCITASRQPESAHSAFGVADSPLEALISVLEHLRRSRQGLTEVFTALLAAEDRWSGIERAAPQLRILGLRQPAVVGSGNVLGSRAEARVEIRYHPPLTSAGIAVWLAAVLGEVETPGVTYSQTCWNEPAVLPEESGLAGRVIRLARAAGIEVTAAAFPAGSDMSPLINLHRIPTCIVSAADLVANRIHGDDERISEAELLATVKLYAILMLGFCGDALNEDFFERGRKEEAR